MMVTYLDRPRHSSPSLLVLVLLAVVPSCQAAMSAWYTALGPQFLLQNATTGGLRYSACNSVTTPTYSNDDASNELKVGFEPRNGTALAGTGWYDYSNEQTVASIFFQAANNDIVNAYATCNMTTGKFETQGTYTVSRGAPSIHNTTGLAVVLLGADDGYRVYYHDVDLTVHQLSYTTKVDWHYAGAVSQDTQASLAITAGFSTDLKITVVTARDAANIEISRWDNTTKAWSIATFPQPLSNAASVNQNTTTDAISLNATAPATGERLSAWSGNPAALGLAVAGSGARMLFYIGNDSTLQQVTDTGADGAWAPQTSQSTSIWPRAAAMSAELAVASSTDSNDLRIYYVAEDGKLVELRASGKALDKWSAFAAVSITSASTPTAGTSTPSSTPSSSSTASSAGGLSSGAKAGIGIGVTLGLLALAGMAFALWLFRRRHVRQVHAAASPDGVGVVETNANTVSRQGSSSCGSYGYDRSTVTPASAQKKQLEWDAVAPQQMDSQTAPSELGALAVYEMPAVESAYGEMDAGTVWRPGARE